MYKDCLYALYEWKDNGEWAFIRNLSYNELQELEEEWNDMFGMVDNDFGIIDNMVMFTHNLLNRIFVAQVM